MTSRKRVCVIGAGASGLGAVKSCLDEDMTPVCYERSDHIGGLWCYREELHEDACTYKSTIINTSKEMMAFSDFPPPNHFANFMHNTKVMEYFQLYADRFDLKRHIIFETEVLSCEYAEDYAETGRWLVKTKNLSDGSVSEDVFDGVLICIGHHAKPHFPKESFEGLDEFQGVVMHSHDYRTPTDFHDKRVLVVGIGNSGGDIAVETSGLARQVYLSTRRGSWVINRVAEGGMPFDYNFSCRLVDKILMHTPLSFTSWVFEKVACSRFSHQNYCLKPKHSIVSQHPMVNDDLPNRILSGRVVVKHDVTRFHARHVTFKDGSEAEVDVIVFATGYRFTFPFLHPSVVEVKENKCDLYKNMWPPSQAHNTLAVIGLVQPLGAVNPVSEMQSRWATRVIRGLNRLPAHEVMAADIAKKHEEMRQVYYESPRHTIQVDYLGYMDEIADQFGVKPNILKLFLESPSLGMKILFGPVTPYQYRLHGPGSNKDAVHMINGQEERVMAALKTRTEKVDETSQGDGLLMKLVVLLFVVYIVACRLF